jgi:uncharacterized Zn finger protein (UPF0148 family)
MREKYGTYGHKCKGAGAEFSLRKSCLKCVYQELKEHYTFKNSLSTTDFYYHNCNKFDLELKGDFSKAEKCPSYITDEKSKELILCRKCHYYTSETDTLPMETGIFIPNYNFVTLTIYHCAKFGFRIKDNGKEAEKCTSYITDEEHKERALSGELYKDKTNVQIIIDFSSLKDVMSKGGLVMTTYKCPNCNGMVNIPEAGKVLVCQYCGTPIKPVDIFEKIKSLIQSGETVTENPKEVESKLGEQENESKPDWYGEALKQHNIQLNGDSS